MQDANADSTLIYVEQVYIMKEHQLTTMYVDYTHILQKDDVLAQAIQTKYYRFMPYLKRAVRNLVAQYSPEYLQENPSARSDQTGSQAKDFSVAFYRLPLVSGIRDLKTERIGTLMSVSGTVTRTSEVRPELLYGRFICEVCRGSMNEIEQQFKYTEVWTSFLLLPRSC
jgi:DNA replication licensing factor MCM6